MAPIIDRFSPKNQLDSRRLSARFPRQFHGAPLAGLRDELYADLDARTQQTDLSVPSFVTHTSGDSFWYYTRTVEGLAYPIHCRVAASGRDQIPDVGDAPLPDLHAWMAGTPV